jgi:predicted nucleic-acid-binding protein
VFIPVEIVAEIVYVLEKVYKVDRKDILSSINELTNYNNICINEQEVVCSALKYYASIKLDFVDCLLLSYHNIKKFQVDTFDDKLRKHLERMT